MPFHNTSDISRINPILKMYEIGMSHAEIKEMLHTTLRPFLRRPEHSLQADLGAIAIEAIQVGYTIQDSVNEELLHAILALEGVRRR